MERTVEFYVLRTDRTWTTEMVYLSGNDALLGDQESTNLARSRLESKVKGDPCVECIGPLYWLSEATECECDN